MAAFGFNKDLATCTCSCI